MARESKASRLARVHSEALLEFDQIQNAVRDERMQCLQDRRFAVIAGAQWEGSLGIQFANRPKFEVNKVMRAINRIVSEKRNNPVTSTFQPRDGKGDDKLADTVAAIHRADEQDSVADEAYDNAFEEAVSGGFGAWRLRAVKVDDLDDSDDDEQRIRFEPIYDADSSVFFSLDGKRQDKSDSRTCFVVTGMSRAAYEAEYDDSPDSWPHDIQETVFDWCTEEVVHVAEYYVVEKVRETLRVFRDLLDNDEEYTDKELNDDDGKLLETLTATGSREVRRVKKNRKRVRKYILSGGKVLDDCGYIAGPNIPIVANFGKRFYVDGVERCMGHVRMAKDPQRLKNMQLSKLAEISALSSVSKPIVAPEQVAGLEEEWRNDNLENFAFLRLNPLFSADGQMVPGGPLAWTKAPEIPPAMAALLQITETDMQEILGESQGTEQIVSNVSGKAVDMTQQRLDMPTFIYMSNHSKAMRRSGEIYIGMSRELYVEEGRKMKTVSVDGKTSYAEMNVPSINDEGVSENENDLTAADFDVVVEVGPSSSSKRAATVRELIGMMQLVQNDPETMSVLTSMAMANMEGEGISDVRDFFRQKLLRMGVAKPTEEETAQMEAESKQAKPDPQAEYLKAAASQAEAEAAGARAKTVLTIAQAEKARADTAKTEVETLEVMAGLDAASRTSFGPGGLR